MTLSPSFSYPLSVELLDTQRCRQISAQINEFENGVFGPDFFCDYEAIRPWVDTGSLFCATMCGEAVAGRKKILSVASVLITSRASRDRLMRGEIADHQLLPWTCCPDRSQPEIYFASVISDNPEHLTAIYRSLGHDVESHLTAFNLVVESGFSISAGAAGLRHLTRSGFVALDGNKYMHKYDLMTIDGSTAKTDFWQRLLRPHGRHQPMASAERLAGAPPFQTISTDNSDETRAP